MNWFACTLAVGGWLAAGAASQAASCGVRFEISTNYYAVTGQTAAALFASLRQSRPASTNGSFDATTTWAISWTCRYSLQPVGVCLDRVEIVAKITLTMPRWTPSPGAPPELAQRWQRYCAALAAHEQGHVRLVREAVSEMQKGVASLDDFDSTTAMRKALNGVGTQVIEKARQRERQYDADTGHGRTQGAVWR